MANNTGTAEWKGGLKDGNGSISTQSGAISNSSYTFGSRFEENKSKTNPEELIGAAHAACFSMFLASLIEKEGKTVNSVKTDAVVSLSKNDSGPFISKIVLKTEGDVQDLSEDEFKSLAQKAKEGCPVSKALGAVPEINLEVSLKK